jgi:hypothetical protein
MPALACSGERRTAVMSRSSWEGGGGGVVADRRREQDLALVEGSALRRAAFFHGE